MAAETFNSLGGFSIGIPANTVVDANGNVFASNYFYSNGTPFTGVKVGGANTQIQFNDAGNFNGSSSFTFNKTTNRVTIQNANITGLINLGDLANVTILGGNNGYFLQTDGAGNLTWAAGGGGGGNGSPGGANTQIQFNDAGTFGGDSGFTYNKVTNTLHVENISAGDSSSDTVNIIGNVAVTGNIELSTDMTVGNSLTINNSAILNVVGNLDATTSANVSLGNISNLHIDGGTYGQLLATDGTGNLYWATGGGGSNGNPGGISQSVQFNDAGAFGGESVFVYDQVLNRLSVPQIKSNVSANFVGASLVNLGNVANLKISGGFNGYVLTTDGSGNLNWSAGGGGGNGVPGGSNTQIQYNNNGSFGGSPYLTFNDYTNTVQIGGNLIANSVQMGAGAYKWSTSQVYFASTASASPSQVLFSIPVADCSGVEFEIIATEPAGPSRQFCKISSIYYDGTVQFNEYASLFVNGGVGNFEVDYNGGNIIVQPSLELKVTPSSANPITYKMLITVFAA